MHGVQLMARSTPHLGGSGSVEASVRSHALLGWLRGRKNKDKAPAGWPEEDWHG